MRLQSTALALVIAAGGAMPAFAQTNNTATTNQATAANAAGQQKPDVISLNQWRYDPLYQKGVSARAIMDADVYGASDTTDEIGNVEDIVASRDGRILAVIAEVGGFWDIGDTHVSVPWDEVEVTAAGVVLPLTEDTVDDYGIFDRDYLTAPQASSQIVGEVDDAETGPRAYRLSELIGDYARLRGNDDTMRNYGYVRDVVIDDGKVDAVVVSPASGYTFGTPGYRAYPYSSGSVGYGPYYDMPYSENDARDLGTFDYDAMSS